MPNEQVTDPTLGAPSGDKSASPEHLLAEVTRLRQDLAKSRDLNREAQPLVQLAIALSQAPGGEEIIRKVKAGEPLTVAEEKKVAAVADSATGGQTAGLTAESIQKLVRAELQQYAQADWETRKAEREMSSLNEKASKELEGYEALTSGDNLERWNTALNTVLALMESKSLVPPVDEPDAIYWAIKHTHQNLTGLKPGEKRVTPAKKTEQERLGSIAGQAGSQGGAPEEDKSDNSPEMRWAQARAQSTVGKSFANS
jgi:hypothetical protein